MRAHLTRGNRQHRQCQQQPSYRHACFISYVTQWVRSTSAKTKGLAEHVKSVVQFRL